MKATGLLRHLCVLPLAGAMALWLHPAAALAVPNSTSLVESRLGGGTILNSPVQKLAPAVRDSVKENPLRSGAIVTAVLKAGRADSDAIAPQVTVAAIEGLGSGPSQALVGEIITASVKATPAVVLEIVKTSVKAAPSCAKTIVRAAVKAVPNPNDKIQPVAELTSDAATGYSKDDGKDLSKDLSKEPGPGIPPVPIAEAIAQAALQGDPGQSYQELLSTANQAATEHGGISVTEVYTGYYYPPIVVIRTKNLRPGLPGPSIVSP